MSEENGVVVEQTSSNDASEATAAAAAFANARGETPPEPVKVTDKPESTEQARDDQGKFVAEAEKSDVKLFAGKTEEEIVALLAEIPAMKDGYRKQIDNLAGNYGKLNAAFTKLQGETPQGRAVEVTDEDLKDMAAEYPELAGLQKAVLNKILGKMRLTGTSQADPAESEARFSSLVEQGVKKHLQITNTKRLDRVMPDWETVIGTPDTTGAIPQTEYRKWLASQPASYQKDVAESIDADEILDSVKAFQAAKEAASKKQEQNKQRLKNAVQPEGAPAARGVISEQEAADRAFKARRQR